MRTKTHFLQKYISLLLFVIGCDKHTDSVNEHLRHGDQALSEGHYAQALSAYAHAHELEPTDTRVQRAQMRARVYLMATSPLRVAPEALEDMTYEATFLRDTDPTLESVCLSAQGQILARRGDLEGAKNKIAEAIKIDAQSPIPHIALGMVSLNEPEGLATAKIEFELALQKKPDAVGALVGLGQVKLAEGDVNGAVEKLEAAARRDDDLPIHLALGTARLRQGKHADAVRELRRALAFDPKNVDAQSAMGQALLGLGHAEEAEGFLTSALQSRNDPATAISLGFALIKLGQAEKALAIFNPVLIKDPLSAPSLYGAGMANEQLGRQYEAFVLYKRLLAIPAEGPQKNATLDLQKDARSRMNAFPTEVTSPPPSSSAKAPPAPTPPVNDKLLNGRQ